jgi:hypothetical protein
MINTSETPVNPVADFCKSASHAEIDRQIALAGAVSLQML